jgi:hypothetical protein
MAPLVGKGDDMAFVTMTFATEHALRDNAATR